MPTPRDPVQIDLEEWLACHALEGDPFDALDRDPTPDEEEPAPELGAELAADEPPIFGRTMAGRCATGAERDRGARVHAVADDRFPSFAAALCGAAPGRRGNGWTAATPAPIDCPRCARRLSR